MAVVVSRFCRLCLTTFHRWLDKGEMSRAMWTKSGLRSRSRKESEVFGWSRSRIPNNTGSEIFCPTPTPDVQLDHLLHHIPKLGIPVKMVQFLL